MMDDQTTPQYKFMFIGFGKQGQKDFKTQLVSFIFDLGGTYIENEKYHDSCTHFICIQPWPCGIQKFLGACATGKWVLTPEYIEESRKSGRWLAERDFEWGVTKKPTVAKIHSALPEWVKTAPKRNRMRKLVRHKLNAGLPFKKWVTCIAHADRVKRFACEEILKHGGARIKNLTSYDDDQAYRGTTHIFSERIGINLPYLNKLEELGIKCLHIDFIRDFILKNEKPREEDYYIEKYSLDLLRAPSSESLKALKYDFRTLKLRIERGKVERYFRQMKQRAKIGANTPKQETVVKNSGSPSKQKERKYKRIKSVDSESNEAVSIETSKLKKEEIDTADISEESNTAETNEFDTTPKDLIESVSKPLKRGNTAEKTTLENIAEESNNAEKSNVDMSIELVVKNTAEISEESNNAEKSNIDMSIELVVKNTAETSEESLNSIKPATIRRKKTPLENTAEISVESNTAEKPARIRRKKTSVDNTAEISEDSITAERSATIRRRKTADISEESNTTEKPARIRRKKTSVENTAEISEEINTAEKSATIRRKKEEVVKKTQSPAQRRSRRTSLESRNSDQSSIAETSSVTKAGQLRSRRLSSLIEPTIDETPETKKTIKSTQSKPKKRRSKEDTKEISPRKKIRKKSTKYKGSDVDDDLNEPTKGEILKKLYSTPKRNLIKIIEPPKNDESPIAKEDATIKTESLDLVSKETSIKDDSVMYKTAESTLDENTMYKTAVESSFKSDSFSLNVLEENTMDQSVIKDELSESAAANVDVALKQDKPKPKRPYKRSEYAKPRRKKKDYTKSPRYKRKTPEKNLGEIKDESIRDEGQLGDEKSTLDGSSAYEHFEESIKDDAIFNEEKSTRDDSVLTEEKSNKVGSVLTEEKSIRDDAVLPAENISKDDSVLTESTKDKDSTKDKSVLIEESTIDDSVLTEESTTKPKISPKPNEGMKTKRVLKKVDKSIKDTKIVLKKGRITKAKSEQLIVMEEESKVAKQKDSDKTDTLYLEETNIDNSKAESVLSGEETPQAKKVLSEDTTKVKTVLRKKVKRAPKEILQSKMEAKDSATKTEPKEIGTKTETKESPAKTEPEGSITKTEPEEIATKTELEESATKTELEESATKTELEESANKTEPKESTKSDREPKITKTKRVCIEDDTKAKKIHSEPKAGNISKGKIMRRKVKRLTKGEISKAQNVTKEESKVVPTEFTKTKIVSKEEIPKTKDVPKEESPKTKDAPKEKIRETIKNVPKEDIIEEMTETKIVPMEELSEIKLETKEKITETTKIKPKEEISKAKSLPVPKEEIAKVKGLSVPMEEIAKAKSLPVPKEEIAKVKGLSVPMEEIAKAKSLPVPKEEIAKVKSLSVPMKEIAKAKSLPVPKEEIAKAKSLPVPKEENTKTKLLPKEEITKTKLVPKEEITKTKSLPKEEITKTKTVRSDDISEAKVTEGPTRTKDVPNYESTKTSNEETSQLEDQIHIKKLKGNCDFTATVPEIERQDRDESKREAEEMEKTEENYEDFDENDDFVPCDGDLEGFEVLDDIDDYSDNDLESLSDVEQQYDKLEPLFEKHEEIQPDDESHEDIENSDDVIKSESKMVEESCNKPAVEIHKKEAAVGIIDKSELSDVTHDKINDESKPIDKIHHKLAVEIQDEIEPEDKISEKLEPEDKIPEVKPEDKIPEVKPEDKILEELEPEAKIPEKLEPEDKIPQECEPEDKIPEECEPEDKIPEELEPEDKIPEELETEDKIPEELETEDKIPEELETEDKIPEELETEDKIPEELETEDKISELETEDKISELETEDKISELETEDKISELETEDKIPELEPEDKIREELEPEDKTPKELEPEDKIPEELEPEDEIPEELEPDEILDEIEPLDEIELADNIQHHTKSDNEIQDETKPTHEIEHKTKQPDKIQDQTKPAAEIQGDTNLADEIHDEIESEDKNQDKIRLKDGNQGVIALNIKKSDEIKENLLDYEDIDSDDEFYDDIDDQNFDLNLKHDEIQRLSKYDEKMDSSSNSGKRSRESDADIEDDGSHRDKRLKDDDSYESKAYEDDSLEKSMSSLKDTSFFSDEVEQPINDAALLNLEDDIESPQAELETDDPVVECVKKTFQHEFLWDTEFHKMNKMNYFTTQGHLEMEMPNSITELFNSVIDEYKLEHAINFFISVLPHGWYPHPKVLNKIIQFLILNPEDTNSTDKASALFNTISCNQPALTPSLSDAYVKALCPFPNAFSKSPWNTLAEIISSCILNQINCHILFKFYIDIFEQDFEAFLRRSTDPAGDFKMKRVTCPVLTQIFWSSNTVGNVTKPLEELFAFIYQSIIQTDSNESFNYLINLLGLVAECTRLAESNSLTIGIVGLRTKELIRTIFEKCRLCELDNFKLYKIVCALKPSWLQAHLISELLTKLPFVTLSQTRIVEPLSLVKILECYLNPIGRKTPDEIAVGGNQMRVKTKSECESPLKATVINRRNRRGETQVHLACLENQPEKLKRLLDVPGVDVNIRDYAGWTPLHEACNGGYVDCVSLLLKHNPGSKNVAQRLKKDPVDIMAKSNDGTTPMHDAVGNDHIEVTKCLLEKGGLALLNIKSNSGVTPLDQIKSSRMKELIKTFTEKHFDKENSPVESPVTVTEIEAQPRTYEISWYLCFLRLLIRSYLRMTKLQQIERGLKTVLDFFGKDATYDNALVFLEDCLKCMKGGKIPEKELAYYSNDLKYYEGFRYKVEKCKLAIINLASENNKRDAENEIELLLMFL